MKNIGDYLMASQISHEQGMLQYGSEGILQVFCCCCYFLGFFFFLVKVF